MRASAAPLALLLALAGCAAATAHAPPIEPPARWAASKGPAIAVFGPEGEQIVTHGHHDWKPVWNPAGDTLAFFRTSTSTGPFVAWRAALMVVQADGSGERQLTDGAGRDFNPTWTRDGSNRILFNRYGVGGEVDRCEVWTTSPEGAPGSEVRLSSPEHRYEWVDAALRDGRLFVDTAVWTWYGHGTMRSFLLTPRPGGTGTYQELRRPTTALWHKLSVSPSETKVVYMEDQGGDLADYRDDVIAWAELDKDSLTVKNPVRVTQPTGRRCVNECPRWSADERLILFDSSCGGVSRVYAYRLSDGATEAISPPSSEPIMFPCAQGVPE